MKPVPITQKSPATKYSARYVESFPIKLPIDKVDLHKWIVEMTNSDYRSYSPAHIAMDSYSNDGALFMINVENIGTDMLVQHYELKFHSAQHVQLYSAQTDAYIMRWIRATVGVPWEMQVRRTSDETCELICLVGVDYPNPFLQVAAFLNGLGGLFLRKHLSREGNAFAKDIEQKFK